MLRPDTDFLIPLDAEGTWNDHTIHTHYFGFTIPERQIGVFIYLRCQPVYHLCSGGVCVFEGMDNVKPMDIEHLDFVVTMPYPRFVDGAVTTANGLTIRFLEAGKKVQLAYRSRDGRASFDVTQTAITPLLPRGHVMPGEDMHSDPANGPGGSEQFMHCLGALTLGGKEHAVDCYAVRDRSWRQVRTEDEVDYPPVGWSPMCFGPQLILNQVGYCAPDTNPIWKGVFDVPADKPSHYFAWLIRNDVVENIATVRREVHAYHPQIHAAVRQTLEVTTSSGQRHVFQGEAIAMAQLPSWPNNIFVDSVYRWTDEAGRIAHCTYQEAWYHKFQQFMKRRAAA